MDGGWRKRKEMTERLSEDGRIEKGGRLRRRVGGKEGRRGEVSDRGRKVWE